MLGVQAIHAKLREDKDYSGAMDMMGEGFHALRQLVPGQVWADYWFIAACYASAGGDEHTVKYAIGEIWQRFPEYDPASRFTWESTGIDDIAYDDVREANAMFDIFRYRAPVITKMNQFCERHPDFSFRDALGTYFPITSDMDIRKSGLEILCDSRLVKMMAIAEAKK
jgi:hypothetical protein